MRLFIFLALLLGLLTPAFSQKKATNSLPKFLKKDIDGYIKKAMATESVPGMAVAVVKDGKIVFARGYGNLAHNSTEKVDENTIFMVASNSKAFTGTLLATLEEEKKLSLDVPVRQYLPDFRMKDSIADRLVTLRDLLSHRTGTATFQGDLTFWNSAYSSNEIMRRYGNLEPSSSFRTKFGYCNTCFLAAGEVIPALTDTSWADALRYRILKPLGMTRTTALSTEIRDMQNVAKPHTFYDGQLRLVPLDNIDNFGPAASMCSSVSDMAKWLIFQTDTGRVGERQIIPKKAILKTWSGNTLMRTGVHPVQPTHFWAYGLGWTLNDYAGRLLISHTGGADGFVSSTAFLPEERLGVVVLTNTDANGLYASLRYQILDAYLGRKSHNHIAQSSKDELAGRKEEAERIAKLRAAAVESPALPLADYCGSFTHPVFGKLKVQQGEQGKLAVTFEAHPNNTGKLTPIGEHQFFATFSTISWGIHPFPFEVKDGKVIACTLKGNDFIEYGTYRFEKDLY